MNNLLKCLMLQGFLLLFSNAFSQKNATIKTTTLPIAGVKVIQGNRKIVYANMSAIEAPKATAKILVTVNKKGEIINSTLMAVGTTITKDNNTTKLILAQLKNIQFNEAAESKVMLEFKIPMAKYMVGEKKIEVINKTDTIVAIKPTPIINTLQGDTFKIKMNNYFATATNAFKILAEDDGRGAVENITNKFLFFYPTKVILVVDSNIETEWKITKKDNGEDELIIFFEKGDKLTYSENEMTIIEKSLNLTTKYMVAPINRRR